MNTATATRTTKMVRPAGMGDQCDCFYRNPAFSLDNEQPYLVRRRSVATRRFTCSDSIGTYVYKRCPACADILRAKAARGATFEILAEEVIK